MRAWTLKANNRDRQWRSVSSRANFLAHWVKARNPANVSSMGVPGRFALT